MARVVRKKLEGIRAILVGISTHSAADDVTIIGGKDENLHMEVEISLICAD